MGVTKKYPLANMAPCSLVFFGMQEGMWTGDKARVHWHPSTYIHDIVAQYRHSTVKHAYCGQLWAGKKLGRSLLGPGKVTS